MIKRYLLIIEKENEVKNQIFFEMNSAEQMQLVYINSGYKTQIIPLSIDLLGHEVREYYDKFEKEDILNDFIYRVSEYHNVIADDFEDVEKDVDVIYFAFKKCEDSDLSHWQNIEKTLDYLKSVSTTNYDYSKIN